ncbi:MAG: hypothetical protein COB36_01360 [Alphaproteobacteria bacterium]|nr:MAG: hypothetical protein COB36_01360 [Alphaproteobacteria bacterium]
MDFLFNIIFDGVSAWTQIGYFLMAFVFIGIGGGLICYELYWRLKADRVKGRIHSVRVTNKRKPNTNDVQSLSRQENQPEPVEVPRGIYVALSVFMLIFTCVGLYLSVSYIHLINTGKYADAQVVRNDSHRDSDGDTLYNAVVRFTDDDGHVWNVTDAIGHGGAPAFAVGKKVGVYYKHNDPEIFVIDDFWHNMLEALIFICVGPMFGGFFFLIISINKKQNDPNSIQSYVGEVYYSVFEYAAPNGDRMEHMGEMGSNSLLNKIPGKRVDLMVFPDSPGKVRRPSLVLPIFGLVFLLPGLFIGHMFVATFDANYMFFVLLVVGIIFLGRKILKATKGMSWQDIKKGWNEHQGEGVTLNFSTKPKELKGRVLDKEEILKRFKIQSKSARISGYIMLVIACGLAGGTYYSGLDMIDRLQNGVRAPAEVVRIKSQYSSSSDSSGYTYYAIVAFADKNGRSVEFKDSVGASSPMYKRGDAVDVIYYPDKPRDAIIDRGVFNWGLSGGLAAGVLLLLWIAIYSFQVSRRFGYMTHRRRV